MKDLNVLKPCVFSTYHQV